MNGAAIRPAAVSNSTMNARCLVIASPFSFASSSFASSSFAAGGAEQSIGTQHQHQRHGHEQHDVGIARVEHRGDADDLAGDQAAQYGAGKRADAADDDDHEGLHQDPLADVGGDRHHRRVDDAGEARRHGADAEHQHEDLVDVDTERIDHHRILDAGAHDHADARAVEHDV